MGVLEFRGTLARRSQSKAAMIDPQLSTGLPGLDRVFQGLMPGDNFVWQVDSLHDFKPLVAPLGQAALARGRNVIYFRFAAHEPLLPKMGGVTVHRLRTDEGFERFLVEVHRVIHEAGRGACLVFDCLSPLVETWCSDRMLANFFLLTSAYVHDHRSLAYFPLLRNFHSFHASTPIAETAQVLVDLYRHGGQLYLHPTKVEGRYSPTIHMLHRWEGDAFLPVTESSTDRRDPHLAAVGRAGVDPPAAGQVDPHLPPGRGNLAGHPPAATGPPRTPKNSCPNCST